MALSDLRALVLVVIRGCLLVFIMDRSTVRNDSQ